MTELPMSDPSKKKTISFQCLSASVSNFIVSCCLPVFSQPLYLCYFLFFSPYIVRLLSFLSPLFVTTSLALLCLLLSIQQEPNSASEELELYEILFETSPEENAAEQEVQEAVDKFLIHEGETGEALIQEKGGFDGIRGFHVKEGQEVKQLGTVFEKVVAAVADELEREESNAHVGDDKLIIPRRRQSSRNFSSSSSDGLGVDGVDLGGFGSMRKEKEWRRTLACKLFEERHNADGGEEGMDLLWERHEDDLTRARGGRRRERRRKDPESIPKKRHDDKDEDEDEARDDGREDQQICCLQALKLSAGKMNIVRVSRAFRGIGWLHNVTRRRKA